MAIVLVRDCIGANLGASAWGGQMAGYSTGSGDVPWTAAQFAARPGTIVIDQSPSPTIWDAQADIDDYENGAVRLDELAPRAKERKASFAAATRPGQREPGIYASASNITPVVNALIAGGVTSGVGLWIANWGVTEQTAAQQVITAAGPFPVIGWQFASPPATGGPFDLSVFSAAWLQAVSISQPPPPITGPPYRKLTQPNDTVAGLAAGRNETPRQLLTVSVQAYTDADVTQLAGHHLPGGLPWYTLHP